MVMKKMQQPTTLEKRTIEAFWKLYKNKLPQPQQRIRDEIKGTTAILHIKSGGKHASISFDLLDTRELKDIKPFIEYPRADQLLAENSSTTKRLTKQEYVDLANKVREIEDGE